MGRVVAQSRETSVSSQQRFQRVSGASEVIRALLKIEFSKPIFKQKRAPTASKATRGGSITRRPSLSYLAKGMLMVPRWCRNATVQREKKAGEQERGKVIEKPSKRIDVVRRVRGVFSTRTTCWKVKAFDRRQWMRCSLGVGQLFGRDRKQDSATIVTVNCVYHRCGNKDVISRK